MLLGKNDPRYCKHKVAFPLQLASHSSCDVKPAFHCAKLEKNGFVLYALSPDVSNMKRCVIALRLRGAEIKYEESHVCSASDSKWQDKLCNNLSGVIHNGRFLVVFHGNPLMSPLSPHLQCYSSLLPLIAMLKRNERHYNERRENESDDEKKKE